MTLDDDSSRLAEQVDYYRARAPEYDEWYFRQGRYDRGEHATAAWFAELDEVRNALDALPLDEADVVELAPGTGLWTQHLAPRARHLTVIDAAPEMLEVCRHRLTTLEHHNVTYEQHDLFARTPSRAFDAVVFCFWISHVPDSRLDAFLRAVHDALKPGGVAFFVDSKREPTSTAADHPATADADVFNQRRLNDGREFTVFKYHRSAALFAQRFAAADLSVRVEETATYFQYGIASRLDRLA